MDHESYFKDVLKFFHDSQWIFNTPVTEILVKNSLDNFPNGWLDVLQNLNNDELNNFVAEKKYETNWPNSLIKFVEKCKEIDRLEKPEPEPNLQLPSLFLKGLTPKKQHEILHLTNLVRKQCLEENISTIVDFGAGLGYVCQLLNYLYNYKILGLESNRKNVEIAEKRQKTFYQNSVNHVKYSQCEINEFSLDTIREKLETEFNDSLLMKEKICLIGLHACADLSVSIMKIFTQFENARLLILLSCCYHKLSMTEVNNTMEEDSAKENEKEEEKIEENEVGEKLEQENEERTNQKEEIEKQIEEEEKEFFPLFPLSMTLKNAIQSSNLNCNFMRRTFLRLACQEPAERWRGMSSKSHENHAFHVIARAVLQLYAVRNQLELKKLVQKGTRKSQCENFPMYLKDSLKRYKFIPSGKKG